MPRQRSLMLLSLAWVAVILVFFSVSARLEHYVFPALPALAILVAVALSRTEDSQSVKWAFRSLAILGMMVLAAAIGVGIWFVATGHSFGSSPRTTTDTAYDSDFSILAEMPAVIQWNLLKPAAVTVLALAIGFWAALRFEIAAPADARGHERRRRHDDCLRHDSLEPDHLRRPDLVKEVRRGSRREARPGDRLVVMGDYESANSLNFYQPLHVEVFDGVAYFLDPGDEIPGRAAGRYDAGGIRRRLEVAARVFALVPLARLGDLDPGGVVCCGFWTARWSAIIDADLLNPDSVLHRKQGPVSAANPFPEPINLQFPLYFQ